MVSFSGSIGDLAASSVLSELYLSNNVDKLTYISMSRDTTLLVISQDSNEFNVLQDAFTDAPAVTLVTTPRDMILCSDPINSIILFPPQYLLNHPNGLRYALLFTHFRQPLNGGFPFVP